jgi:hypothetical protein
MLDTCIRRIQKSEYEEFELDKSTEYNASTAEGVFNQETAAVLLGSIEALMEHVVSKGYRDAAEEAKVLETVQKLFKFSSDLKHLIREKLASVRIGLPLHHRRTVTICLFA